MGRRASPSALKPKASFRGELPDGGLVEGFAGLEDGGGEIGMVGRIGIVLGFETEAGVPGVGSTGGTFEGSVEEVAGVELDAGLGGPDFEDATGFGILGAGGKAGRCAGGIEAVVVVVAA